MKYKEGDILILKHYKEYKIIILNCSKYHYNFKYIITPEETLLEISSAYTSYYINLENVCDFCPDYIREKKLKKILR